MGTISLYYSEKFREPSKQDLFIANQIAQGSGDVVLSEDSRSLIATDSCYGGHWTYIIDRAIRAVFPECSAYDVRESLFTSITEGFTEDGGRTYEAGTILFCTAGLSAVAEKTARIRDAVSEWMDLDVEIGMTEAEMADAIFEAIKRDFKLKKKPSIRNPKGSAVSTLLKEGKGPDYAFACLFKAATDMVPLLNGRVDYEDGLPGTLGSRIGTTRKGGAAVVMPDLSGKRVIYDFRKLEKKEYRKLI